MSKKQDIQFQIECLTTELTEMLMETYEWDIKRALDELFGSETFARLNDPNADFTTKAQYMCFLFLKTK